MKKGTLGCLFHIGGNLSDQSMEQLPPANWATASLAMQAASKASRSSPEQPSHVDVVVSPAMSQVHVVSWLQEVSTRTKASKDRGVRYFMGFWSTAM